MMMLLLLAQAGAVDLRQDTLQAFDRHIRTTESRLDPQVRGERPFLWCDEVPERAQKVREGEILIQPWSGSPAKVPDGLIHDWVGAVFIPGTTLEKTLVLLENYDRHKDVYKPEVIDSKLLHRNGNDFKIYLRLLKKKVLTVVLNTEHEVHYVSLDRTRWHSRSYSTRIAEVENPGKRNERERPVGTGHGFLWRLNSYWRFQERNGGVYLECEAISLTRAVPTGLGWLIEPIVKNLPRESLYNTLRATREALSGQR